MAHENILDYPKCEGTLSRRAGEEHHTADISFALRVDPFGEVRILVEDQPLTAKNIWILSAYSSNDPVAVRLTLDGRNSDELVLHSDSVVFTAVRSVSTPTSSDLQMSARAQWLLVRWPAATSDSARTYCAEYGIAGLRWFGGARFELSEYTIAVAGAVEDKDFSFVSGTLSISSPRKERELADWLRDVDGIAQRVLEVVSFADGHFMRPAVRQAFKDETICRAEFFGRREGGVPYKPPLHYLNFTNSLPALIRVYDAALISRTGLDVAIEWHLMPHLYNESRFLAQMTAIEHLVDVFVEQSPDSTYVEKRLAKTSLVPALVKTLGLELEKLELGDEQHDEALEGITRNLRGVNRRSLRSQLNRMLVNYRVPLEGLEDLIDTLINTRNDLVHRGLHHSDDKTLSQRVTEAEELVRRIILAVLGFGGRYTTWLNRIEDREFSLTPPSTSSPAARPSS